MARSWTTSTSRRRDGVLHVRNAPSPAATSSLAIGDRLAAQVLDWLGAAGRPATSGRLGAAVRAAAAGLGSGTIRADTGHTSRRCTTTISHGSARPAVAARPGVGSAPRRRWASSCSPSSRWPGLAGAGVALATYVRLAGDLPDPTQLEQIELPQQSVVYDRTGTVELARFGDFNRQVVTFDQIPPVLIDATTAVEDRTFWENAGFDPVGIISAGLDALRGNARGASTITQQLVRQRLLTTNGEAQTQVTASRKLREIIQSIRVTEAYQGVEGKQKIITAYLNQNYYGNDAYGVAAAAEAYFGVGPPGPDARPGGDPGRHPQGAVELRPGPERASSSASTRAQPEDTLRDAARGARPTRRSSSAATRSWTSWSRDGTPLTDGRYTAADFDAARNEPVVLAPQRSPSGRSRSSCTRCGAS